MTRSEVAAIALLLLAASYAAVDAAGIGAAPDDDVSAPGGRRVARPVGPSSGEAIVTRALFVPSRRADFASAGGGGGTIGGFVLRGTLSGVAGQWALFEPARGGAIRRLRVGGTLGGYTLAEIGSDDVMMVRGGERRRIDIGDPSVPAAPPAAADVSASGVAAPAPPAVPPAQAGEPPLPVITSTDAQGQDAPPQ